MNSKFDPLSSATSIGVELDHCLIRMPKAIHFGLGTFDSAATTIREHGRRALICTDSRLGSSGLVSGLRTALSAVGVESMLWDQTEPEVPSDNVVACVADALAQPGGAPDLVIGLGGGSCLDMAKAAALLLSHGGNLSQYYGENQVPGPTLPVVAIPTTAGTGSEATPVAVIADRARGSKIGISSPFLIPDVAIVDPRLSASCPAQLTAVAGADAVTHLVEAFTAVKRDLSQDIESRVFVGKSMFTDSIALEGLRLMSRSLQHAHLSPTDEQARSDVAAAALAGGLALGTAGTAAAHALQYPIGALTGTPHGAGVGALLPYVMRFNLSARVKEFGMIARAMGVNTSDLAAEEAAQAGILAVDALLDAIGIPRNLAELGVREDQLAQIAATALGSRRLIENNPVPLDEASLLFVLEQAQSGARDFTTYAPSSHGNDFHSSSYEAGDEFP